MKNNRKRWIQVSIIQFSLFLSGCTSNTPWILDSITTGDKLFDSARLLYRDNQNNSNLRLEFLRIASSVELFLNLSQYHISSSSSNDHTCTIQLTLGNGTPFEIEVPILEGGMRLRLPEEATLKITRTLQEGQGVGIVVDGFEETFLPEQFSKIYDKFTGNVVFFKNPFKGPME